jgi:glycosyltransferase involved in cell wall biosynthesis
MTPLSTMISSRAMVVLHYTGYAVDGGGVMRVIRTLAAAGLWRPILGVSPGFVDREGSRLHCWTGPVVEAEKIGAANLLRTLRVAWRVRRWLRRGPHRIFHGHSRAGLLVALWLRLLGERRVMATVHTWGRQRWFYRLAGRLMGRRLHWLSPAMARYYGAPAVTWAECLTDCVPDAELRMKVPRPREPREFTFGCAGSIVPIKQWELCLQALALVPPAIKLRVRHAGSENGTEISRQYAAGLKRLAAEPAVAGRWEWCGQFPDLRAFFPSIDGLIVASKREASSVAALEAMIAGVPVLAAATSGTNELVQYCAGGENFADDAPADLAEKMIALAQAGSPALSAGKREMLQRFAATAVAAKHEDVYRALA